MSNEKHALVNSTSLKKLMNIKYYLLIQYIQFQKILIKSEIFYLKMRLKAIILVEKSKFRFKS